MSQASWGFIYRPYHVTKTGPDWARKMGGKLHDSLDGLGQCPSKLTTFGRGIRSVQKHNFGATIDIYVYVKIGRAQLPATSFIYV